MEETFVYLEDNLFFDDHRLSFDFALMNVRGKVLSFLSV